MQPKLYFLILLLAILALVAGSGGTLIAPYQWNYSAEINATTTISTVLDKNSTPSFYRIDASAANKTLTLPDAALVKGREYVIKAVADPGSFFVRINATGSDHIETNHFYVSTDTAPSAVIRSDGVQYWVISYTGTWAAHA